MLRDQLQASFDAFFQLNRLYPLSLFQERILFGIDVSVGTRLGVTLRGAKVIDKRAGEDRVFALHKIGPVVHEVRKLRGGDVRGADTGGHVPAKFSERRVLKKTLQRYKHNVYISQVLYNWLGPLSLGEKSGNNQI